MLKTTAITEILYCNIYMYSHSCQVAYPEIKKGQRLSTHACIHIALSWISDIFEGKTKHFRVILWHHANNFEIYYYIKCGHLITC